MARLPRLAVPGQLHLLIQQIRRGESPFDVPEDRVHYLRCLAEGAEKQHVDIHAYGLSGTEVRLLVTPTSADALGHMVQAIGRSFVAAYNRRHGRHGTLWEGRFRSTVVEAHSHFLPCLHFTEHASSAEQAEWSNDAAPWSSIPHHSGQRHDPFITEHPVFWALGNTPFEREAAYRALLQRGLDAAEAQGIALASHRGWALGSDEFVSSLGSQIARRLRPLSAGRPALAERDEHRK